MTADSAAASGPAADAPVLDSWWRHFVATGRLPAELPLVQGRLVRAVHRGELPSGAAFVKVMTFPRPKDRLRYLVRALPAAHEASLLRRVAAASIPCPEVLACRTARQVGLPWRSMLVLRALPVVAEAGGDRLAAAAALATRLLAAGIVHRDLHHDNFVRLADGSLAVLDLQSASWSPRPKDSKRHRLLVAARLLRDRGATTTGDLAALRHCGLLRDEAEAAAVLAHAAAARRHYELARIRRCLQDSTEFTRSFGWRGVTYQRRGPLVDGHWLQGGRRLRRAWLGQRVQQLQGDAAWDFLAYFESWWWRGGGGALYVSDRCRGELIQQALESACSAWDRFVGRGRT